MKIPDEDIRACAADWKTKGHAQATWRSYERHLRAFRSQGHTLSLLDAREWLAVKKSVHEARMAGRALKHYSKWSAEEYDEPDEYARLILPKQPPATKNTVATPEDVDKLLAVCTRSADEIENFLALRDAALIHVFACTGCRLGEVSRMDVKDLDTATRTITLPKTKNGDVRRTQLTTDAMRAIRRYQRVAPPASELSLFVTWTNRRMSADAIRKAITRRCKEAKVNITPHSFRRGFAMLWLRRGGSETHLMTIAGWKTHSMVGRYVKAVAGEEALLEQERLFAK